MLKLISLCCCCCCSSDRVAWHSMPHYTKDHCIIYKIYDISEKINTFQFNSIWLLSFTVFSFFLKKKDGKKWKTKLKISTLKMVQEIGVSWVCVHMYVCEFRYRVVFYYLPFSFSLSLFIRSSETNSSSICFTFRSTISRICKLKQKKK